MFSSNLIFVLFVVSNASVFPPFFPFGPSGLQEYWLVGGGQEKYLSRGCSMSQPYLNGLLTIGSTCPLGCGWLVGKGFGVGFDDFPMFDMGSLPEVRDFSPRDFTSKAWDDCCWMAFSGHD